MQKFNILRSLLLLIFLFITSLVNAQIDLERYDGGPGAVRTGSKLLLFGGVIWGGSLLLIILIKSANKNTELGETFIGKVLGYICAIGGIIALVGLAMAGF